MPNIGQELEVFNSIVIPDMILMMDNFPTVKTSSQVLSHDQTVFMNIAIPCTRHRIKEVITL